MHSPLAAVLVIAAIAAAPQAHALAAVGISYNLQTAFTALHYSKVAYCDQSVIASWTCPACGYFPASLMRNVLVTEAAYETQAFVAYNQELHHIVVAFRGSSNLPNWIADLSFAKVPYPYCQDCNVHEGFYHAYQSLGPAILTHVKSLLATYPGTPVFVTGHSLGAALSMLCALDVMRSANPAGGLSLYNFGEPRVGDNNFALYASTIIPGGSQIRVTHRRDPVPHLPPESFGFLHAYHEVWYNNNGNTSYTQCHDSPSSEDPYCSDSIIADDIDDHLLYLGIHTNCSP